MDMELIEEKVREQFRIDTNCSIEDEIKKFININEYKIDDGARYYGDISYFFRAIIYHGELYMSADEKILDWCREKYGLIRPEWFCKFDILRELDEKLKEFGYRIRDTHVYFLPDPSFEGYEFSGPYETRWFDRDDIEKMRGDDTFCHALMFEPSCPDVIAVAAVYNGEMIAMAGASEDGKNMWQIGIDVLPQFEGKGIAVYLVTTLKNRILEMGKVPFYGTSESHSNSMDVAIRSGFLPAFTEVFAKKEE